MKIRIGKTERIVHIEFRSAWSGDLQEFMREHYPRKHGWPDEQKALEYLRNQLNGPFMAEFIENDSDLIKDKIWTEDSEYWVEESD